MAFLDVLLIIIGVLAAIILIALLVFILLLIKTINDIKETAHTIRDVSTDIRDKKLSELIENPKVREHVLSLLSKRFGFFAPLFAALASFVFLRFRKKQK